jgi:hypothetical protein
MSYDLSRLRNRLVMNVMSLLNIVTMMTMVVVTMPRFGRGDKKQTKKYDADDAQHMRLPSRLQKVDDFIVATTPAKF